MGSGASFLDDESLVELISNDLDRAQRLVAEARATCAAEGSAKEPKNCRSLGLLKLVLFITCIFCPTTKPYVLIFSRYLKQILKELEHQWP